MPKTITQPVATPQAISTQYKFILTPGGKDQRFMDYDIRSKDLVFEGASDVVAMVNSSAVSNYDPEKYMTVSEARGIILGKWLNVLFPEGFNFEVDYKSNTVRFSVPGRVDRVRANVFSMGSDMHYVAQGPGSPDWDDYRPAFLRGL